MRKWCAARPFLIALAILSGVAALAWNAAEAHYRGCVEAAVARTEGVRIPSLIDQASGDHPSGGQRVKAVKGCSRLP